MDTPPLIPSSLNQRSAAGPGDGYPSDQDTSSECSTSSWSDLPSPDEGPSGDELGEQEYHEEEFSGILALAQQARELYDLSGQPSDLEDVIAYLRDALSVAPNDHAARGETLYNLGRDLFTYWQISGGSDAYEGAPESLDESVKLHRQALRFLSPSLDSRALYRHGLAAALRARFDLQGHPEDLEECTTLYRKVLECRPLGHPDRPQALLDLAGAYRTRFESFGEPSDSEQARRLDQDTLDLLPLGHSDRVGALACLADDLAARYNRAGDIKDLYQAIVLQREAQELRPADEQILVALASLLFLRYDASHDLAHFDAAVDLCSKALPAESAASSSPLLHILVDVYCARHRHCHELRYLEEAVSCCKRLLKAEPEYAHPALPCITVSRTILALGSLAHLDSAVDLCTRALHRCSTDAFYHSCLIYTLAKALDARYGATGSDDDANAALRHYVKAVEDPSSPACHGVQYATDWVTFATRTQQFHSLVNASNSTTGLLSHVAQFSGDIEVREQAAELAMRLVEAIGAGISLEAFASPEEAVELVENVREALRTLRLHPTSTPTLDGLPRRMVRRLRHLVQGLAQPSSLVPSFPLRTSLHIAIRQRDRRRRNLRQNFDALVEEARTLQGFEHFLSPPPFDSLVSTCEGGHVVVLLPSTTYCQALVVSSNSATTLHIALPLSYAYATTLANDFACASGADVEGRYESLLEQVWEGAVQPIIDALQLKQASPGHARPRIWWSSSGPLASLPLHAAGSAARDGPHVFDYVVSSYTPTITALRTARELGTDTARTSGENKVPRLVDVGLRSWPSSNVGLLRGSPLRRESSIATVMCLGLPHEEDVKVSAIDPTDGARSLSVRPPTVLPCLTYDGENVREGHPATPSSPREDGGFMASDSTRAVLERPDSFNDVASALLGLGAPSIIGAMWPMTRGHDIAAQIRDELERAKGLSDAHVVDAVAEKLRQQGAPFPQWGSLVHVGY